MKPLRDALDDCETPLDCEPVAAVVVEAPAEEAVEADATPIVELDGDSPVAPTDTEDSDVLIVSVSVGVIVIVDSTDLVNVVVIVL